MFQQKGEINFLLSDMENVDIDSLTKLAIVKAIVTSDPYEFIIAVGKIEPFVIDEEDEEDYNKFVREKKKELTEEFGMDEEKLRIALASEKFKYFIRKIKKTVPVEAVGVI